MEPTKQLGLLNLPRELRDLIYEAVIELSTQVKEQQFREFEYDIPYDSPSPDLRPRLSCQLLSTTSPTLNLMQTSHQVYNEIIGMFNAPEIERLPCIGDRSIPGQRRLPQKLCQLDDIKASRQTWHATVEIDEFIDFTHRTTAHWTRIPCPQSRLQNLFVTIRLPPKNRIIYQRGSFLTLAPNEVPTAVLLKLLWLLLGDNTPYTNISIDGTRTLPRLANIVLDIQPAAETRSEAVGGNLLPFEVARIHAPVKDLERALQVSWLVGMLRRKFKNLIVVSWLDKTSADFYDVGNRDAMPVSRGVEKPLRWKAKGSQKRS